MKKAIIIFILLLNTTYAQQEGYKVYNSFSAGELSPLLNMREDMSKYYSGCSLMENMIPTPQGPAEKRPGTVYVAESKNNTKIRLMPFEYSTEQAYIIELGNQYARFYTNQDQILAGSGTEDISALDNIIAHWLLNDNLATTVVLDDDGSTHDGIASANTEDLYQEGKVGTGCFNLAAQYNVSVTDHADFTFIEGTDGDFSITAWAYISNNGLDQTIISKWDETYNSQAREWKLFLDNSLKLNMVIADESLLLDSDLVVHYKLNDNSSNATVTDANGATYNGTLADGSNNYTTDHSVTGKVGTALDFDGSDDKVTIGDHADFSFGDGADDSAFSVSAWINMDDATDFPILAKDTSATVTEWYFVVSASDKLTFVLFDDNTSNYISRSYDTAITANEGSWIHVVATYSGNSLSSGMNIYLDDSDVDDASGDGGAYTAMHDETAVLTLGTRIRASTFANGKIDNVMLFNKELSAAEVTALYNSGDGVEELNTVYPSSITDNALTDGWHFITVVYEGENGSWTGATAANYIDFYVDEIDVDQTATNLSTYSKMEDTTAVVRIGAQESNAGVIENILSFEIDEVGVFNDILSSSEIGSLYDATAIYEVTNPYLTADLFELKFKQSADVLYITHPDYEPHKLSRKTNNTWELLAASIETGPFRSENADETKTITPSGTTGSITLTATGCAPFIAGTTEGHEPSGSSATSKSQTGALWKIVHPLDTQAYEETLEDNYTNDQTENTSWLDCGSVARGVTWYLTTLGTWTGTLEVQRNYTIGAAHGASGWETIYTFQSNNDRNTTTNAEETVEEADYRCILTASGGATEDCNVYFRISDIDHVGVVEITSVSSPTSATATVIKTLANTDATHRWAEGSWSNYRGWPKTVTFYEDRLVFGGNSGQPDTIWGSETANYTNFLQETDDSDPLSFTLSSRQVNVIEWIIGKDKLLIGTSGAEWALSGGTDEPLTPSNVKAVQHSNYGSADLQAILANESVLFFQRGSEKMRELAYNWELDSYVAPDMTILAEHITGDGITDIDYQKTPNAILYCIRDDGEIAIFVYERKELITSWSRFITDGSFESVAVISGDPEDQVWVSVNRTIGGSTKRYVEYFSDRYFGTDVDDAFFVDCGITYDSTATTTITGLDHLEAETVAILGDGAIQTSQTVSSGQITITSASTVQAGMPYTVQMKTMPMSLAAQGASALVRTKRITQVIPQYYNSGDFYVGKDSATKELLSISSMDTSDVDTDDRITFPHGYDRFGQIYIYQQSPEPLTLLGLAASFSVN
jgi:hypothetical protein